MTFPTQTGTELSKIRAPCISRTRPNWQVGRHAWHLSVCTGHDNWSVMDYHMKATMLRSIPSLGVQSRNSETGQNGGRSIPVLTTIPRLDVTWNSCTALENHVITDGRRRKHFGRREVSILKETERYKVWWHSDRCIITKHSSCACPSARCFVVSSGNLGMAYSDCSDFIFGGVTHSPSPTLSVLVPSVSSVRNLR